MDAITFFDMLGIDPGTETPDPAAVAAAAALWPDTIVSRTAGFSATDDSGDTTAIVLFLQGQAGDRTVQFSNVRAGADGFSNVGSGPGQFSLAADMVVGSQLVPSQENTFYFRQLPDIGVSLFNTRPGAPARCFFAKDSRGWELILEALPVVITLKAGLIEPLDPNTPFEGDPPGDFNPDELDSFVVVRNQNPQGTQIYTSVRIHIRPGGDVIFEPNIPVSQPACRFLGLPVKTMYDFLMIPSPANREYYEWARNDLSNFLAPVPVGGAIGFRSLDFDFTQPPFSDLVQSLQVGSVNTDLIELVCEDAVFPLSLGLPLPSHGTFGFRRKIVDRSNLANVFSFDDAPVVIQLYPTGPDRFAPSSASTAPAPTIWSLSIDQLLLQSGEPPVVEFKATFIWHTASGTTWGGTIGIADDWTVQVGVALGDQSPAKFTVVDTTVSIHAAKAGWGFGHMMRQIPYSDCWQLLADLSIQGKPTGGANSWFKMRSLTGKPLSLIIRDVGWSFGHYALDGLTFPEGVQLIFFDTVRLIIIDMGWVEEPSGTSYFSFSGGIGIGFGGGDAIQPSGAPSYSPSDSVGYSHSSNGLAIQVRRLRFNTQDDSHEPFWKMDGLSISLKYGALLVSGFGFFSDDQENGWQVREMGFGVQVQAAILGTTWNLAAQFIKGHRYLITDQSTAFDYFLAALSVGFLPAGAVGLYAVRLLVANNMTPNTDPNATDGQGMALYKWHKDHDSAISLPRDRNLGDWKAVDNTLALGMGCGFSFNGGGSVCHINLFVFYSQGEQERGLLVVGELFLVKNPKPVAFVAVEYDLDTNKFGILAGINLRLSDFVSAGDAPSWMSNLVNLTGNIYFGNQPWTLAIGQLADPRTWLAISVKFSGFNFVFAICFECVDGGPKGGGFLFTLTFNTDFSIGRFSIYGSVGLSIGNWKTGSDATGFEAFAQLGFKIYLFYILHVGLDATVKYSFLGKHPWYKAYSVTLRIDTPWWMPDVSFSIDKSWNEQLPYDVDLLTRPLCGGSAIGIGQTKETALLAPPLSDGNSDPAQLYSFNSFVGVAGVPLGDVHLRTDIPIIETNASIAIQFTNPVSNDMGVASDTYGPLGDAGVQNVKNLTVRYALKSIAVRRSPRYGADAGTWTDLVAPTDTALDTSGNSVQLAPALAFRWDVDSRADGSLSPKRLLLNSSTPYTFSTGASQSDEEAMRNDPGYPCCNRGDAIKRYFPSQHVLAFVTAPAGVRLPARQQFSLQGVWWQWTTDPLPLASAGITAATANTIVAITHPAAAGAIGSAELSDPALKADCALSWTASASVSVFFEGYSGLTLVARQQASLTAAGSVTLSLVSAHDQGMTRLLLRMEGPAVFAAYRLQIEQVSYITLSENARYIGQVARCGSMAATGGKLAFLPNTDYEVTVLTETKVSTTSQGERSSSLSDVVYFRTKGLPGLNSVANPGDEVEPYIDSLYPPAQAMVLYREEPVVLAFAEGLSSILPVDRVPAPTDPPEKTQAMELALSIDRVGATSGLARLTVPAADWIDAHRASPPVRQFPRPILDGIDSKLAVRKAPSADPLTLRYLAVQSASAICTVDPLRASQILIQEPIGANNAAGPWEPSTTLRASVRQKDGPYTQRSSFDLLDSGAFLSQADGSAAPAGAWTINAANLVAPAAGPGRQYASFGELTWNHIRVQAQFDPQGSAAGIAVGVAGGSPVLQAILATVEPDAGGVSLVLRSRMGGVETELGRAAVTVPGPVALTVYAFDDTVRAVAGEVTVEAPRWSVREGRVALVASGPARFSALSVDGLDLYRFDFSTSRYESFTEHIQSWNGNLPELAESTAGVVSTPLSTLLAGDAAAIAGLMQVTADPQARQALFTKWTTELGLPLLTQPSGVSLSRWTGTAGTLALVFESPEPLSFTRDLAVSLIHHIPAPVWHPIGPANLQAALAHLIFAGASVTVPAAFAIFAAGDLIVRVTQPVTGPAFAIYTAPQHSSPTPIPGKLQEVVTPKKGTNPLLDQMRNFAAGADVLVRNKAIVAAADPGIATGPVDQPVPLVVFDNGPETAALLIPASGANLIPLPPGKYTLHLTISRQRWREPNSTNPEAVYSQQRQLELSW